MTYYGICNPTRRGDLTWFTADGYFLPDELGNHVKYWADPGVPQYLLYLMHASQVPNAYVAEYPSGKRVR